MWVEDSQNINSTFSATIGYTELFTTTKVLASLVILRVGNYTVETAIIRYALLVGMGNSEHVCTCFVCKLFFVSSK